MKAGPKRQISVAPIDFGNYPEGRAARRKQFIGEYLITPRGHGAKEPFRLRDFQNELIDGAYAPRIRTGVISIPRANGKTMLAAALGLAEMFVGPPSAEVLVVASDQRQANITMRYAKRMIELNPVLAERMQVYADRIYLPENDATLLPLPAEPGALHGHDPSLMVVDELHVVTEEVWEAVTSVAGKRPESLTLAISTPADSADSVMWRLIEHGRAGTDPSFYLKEYAAPDGCDVNDRNAWREGNPALACSDPFLSEDGLESVLKTIREPVFRQLRLGQWVTGVESWLPWGAWAACKSPRNVSRDERVVFAFDGSASGDSTALVGCTMDGYVWLEGIWENPGDRGWRVPRESVSTAIDLAFDRYNVVELACDPWGWRSEVEAWAKRHGERRVIEWNTGAAQRMAPATDRLYQAVNTKAVTHDGSEELSAHIAHCIAKRTPMGDLVSKDKKGSPRKIDAAVAAIVAFDRAAWYSTRATKRRTVSFA